MTNNKLQSVFWDITNKCNLKCSHCYLDSREKMGRNGDLSLETCRRIIDEIYELNRNIRLILKGGEPLLKREVFDIARYASFKGLRVFLETNGTLINEDVIAEIIGSGISGVGVVIGSLEPEVHDLLKGVKGAWHKTMRGLMLLHKRGVPAHIQLPLTRYNKYEIEEMVNLALSLGHKVLNIPYLICTGGGMGGIAIPMEDYKDVLREVLRLQMHYEDKIRLNVECASLYNDVSYGLDSDLFLKQVQDKQWIEGFRARCPAGLYSCRITCEGYITPCQYMSLPCGDLRELSFREIWDESEVFQGLRSGSLEGRCEFSPPFVQGIRQGSVIFIS